MKADTPDVDRAYLRISFDPVGKSGPMIVREVALNGIALKFNKVTIETEGGEVVGVTCRFLPRQIEFVEVAA
jgi:hypothetical protein